MTKLMIVESPTKAKKIASFLGGDWIVKASLGHIRDLPIREMGVSLQTFEPEYVYREGRPAKAGKGQKARGSSGGGREVVKGLREAASKAGAVYLATDPDREGEAISWHLAEELNLRNPMRIRFHEITKDAVSKAISSPDAIDMNRVRSQEARRVLDRLVGYRVSPMLCDMIGQTVSAGRVQTPALRLVVEREREIQNFEPRDHYGVQLTFDGGWTADWNFKSLLADNEKIWTDRSAAERVAAVRDVIVASRDDKESKSAPKAAFISSTLQQAASVQLKMRVQEAMRIAQRLFEGGHITYHRTDDPNLSAAAIEEIRNFARSKGLALPPGPRRWKAKGGAQEAHEGIRPTHIEVEELPATGCDCPHQSHDDTERAVYRLIRLRALASQLADAVYDVRTIVLHSVEKVLDGNTVQFVGSGRVLKTPGWRAVVGDTVSEDEDAEEARSNPIPALDSGTAQRAADAKVQDKRTQPPPPYTEASLIAELEKREIGRPSTYATIMSTLDNRHYVEMDGKRRLHPTKLGFVVVDSLVPYFTFAKLEFTRIMETEIDKIAEGTSRYFDVVSAANAVLDEELKRLSNADVQRVSKEGPPCPTCHEGILDRRKGQYGWYWSCDAYRRNGCKARFPDAKGKPDFTPRTPVTIDENAPTCPQCGQGKLVRRESKHGAFYGCSRYKDGCKVVYKELPAQGDAA